MNIVIRPARPLHSLLSWSHSLLILAVLSVFSALLYWGARSYLYDELDRHLHRDAEAAQQALFVQTDQWQMRPIEHASDDPFDTEPFFELWNRAGQLLFLPKAHPLLEATRSKRKTPAAGKRRYDTLIVLAAHPVRVAIEPMQVQGQPMVLRVYRSEKDLQAHLWVLKSGLIAALVACSALAAALSWWLTRRALVPLQNLVTTLEQARSAPQWLALRMPPLQGSSEVQALGNSIEMLRQRLQDSYSQLDDFAADCAHELRTPLAALQSHCERLSKSNTSHAAADSALPLGDALQQIDRMAMLIERLLSLARATPVATNSSVGQEEGQPIDLVAVVQHVAELMRPVHEERQQRLQVVCPELQITVQRVWLEQILFDLLHNASRYAPAGSDVWLRVQAAEIGTGAKAVLKPKTLWLDVSDTGSGASDSVLKASGISFEADVKTARDSNRNLGTTYPTSSSGTGLGLKLAQRMAQRLGGELTALRSTDRLGFTLRLVLPYLHQS